MLSTPKIFFSLLYFSPPIIQCRSTFRAGDLFLKRAYILKTRAGHNFLCPLISPLSADPLVNRTALILHFENVNLIEERLFFRIF